MTGSEIYMLDVNRLLMKAMRLKCEMVILTIIVMLLVGYATDETIEGAMARGIIITPKGGETLRYHDLVTI
jgi:hypothetical protein